MKITFLGTPEIGAVILSDLIKSGIKIDTVVTRPDKPKGRSKKLEETAVKKVAKKNKITTYEPTTKKELTNIIKEINPDICIVAAYGMIIPNEALDVPKYGMINFHPSLLPLYRGPSPITAPIINGDKETGVTIIQITEKMDAGDILAQKIIKLSDTETTPDLSGKLASLGTEMIIELIPKIEKNLATHVRQKVKNATYTKMIKKEDGNIAWGEHTAKEIERMSRAYAPWPGVYSFWNNKKINFYDIKITESGIKPGLVDKKDNKILIGTRKDTISPKYIKLEGKNKITTEEFIRGYPDSVGTELSFSG